MKHVVTDWNDWTQSKEFLLLRTSWAIRGFVYLATALFLTAILFLVFGEMEETVQARGEVRPSENVSTVKAMVGGKISAIYFSTGKKVAIGDILLTIDQSLLAAQYDSLRLQFTKSSEQLKGWKLLETAYQMGRLQSSALAPEFSGKWDSYQLDKKKLQIQVSKAHRDLEDEGKIPLSLTSARKLKELEEARDLAEINLGQLNETFEISAIQNISTLETQMNLLATQLLQSSESLGFAVIRAPISGTLWETGRYNVGEMLGAGQEVCRIVSSDEGSKVEIHITAKDGGMVEPGQIVRFRFPAFPYTEFGSLSAKIHSVSPDTEIEGNGSVFFSQPRS